MTSEQSSRIQAEFYRQADSMVASSRFTNETALTRLQRIAGVSDGQRVLDLACGPGIVTEVLANDAAFVVGIDITPAMVSRCRDRSRNAGHENVAPVLG